MMAALRYTSIDFIGRNEPRIIRPTKTPKATNKLVLFGTCEIIRIV